MNSYVGKLEATPRIELGMEVLQTSALPLGYVAPLGVDSTVGLGYGITWPRKSFETSWRGFRRASSWSAPATGPATAGSPPAAWSPSRPTLHWCMVGLEREATTRAAVVEGKAFNVSVLTRSQEFIADRFAGRAPAIDDAWRQVPHRLGTNGIPLIEGCVAWLECSLVANPSGRRPRHLRRQSRGGGPGRRRPADPLGPGFWTCVRRSIARPLRPLRAPPGKAGG